MYLKNQCLFQDGWNSLDFGGDDSTYLNTSVLTINSSTKRFQRSKDKNSNDQIQKKCVGSVTHRPKLMTHKHSYSTQLTSSKNIFRSEHCLLDKSDNNNHHFSLTNPKYIRVNELLQKQHCISNFSSSQNIKKQQDRQMKKKQENSVKNFKKNKESSKKSVMIQTNISFEKIELEITSLKQQNKKSKKQISQLTSQKNQLIKNLQKLKNDKLLDKQNKPYITEKSRHHQSTYSYGGNCQLREMSLKNKISQLLQEINWIKQQRGLVNLQRIIMEYRENNSALRKDLDNLELRCRMLNQKNFDLTQSVKEGKKLYGENKYLKVRLEDYNDEIKYLKQQNKKLKIKKKVYEDSLMDSKIGSDVDSLSFSKTSVF